MEQLELFDPPLRVNYDECADVLYVSAGDPVPSSTEEGNFGILYRFSNEDDSPSGITILAFKKQLWDVTFQALCQEISIHLCKPYQQVLVDLVKAFKDQNIERRSSYFEDDEENWS